VAIRNLIATEWKGSPPWTYPLPTCSTPDGTVGRCNDCTAGYAGARAACIGGLCTVACDGTGAGGCPPTACPGGACHPGGCLYNCECQSGLCVGGVCQAPTCNDGVKNGAETGIDCGGPCPSCDGSRG
jgi:hypothetical protein